MSKRDGRVLRLIPKDNAQFVPLGSKLPTWLALKPHPNDEAEAEAKRTHVRVSVWDLDITQVADAQAHRGKPGLAYKANVAELLEEAVRHSLGHAVAVFPAPCTPEDHSQALQGCEGHCGIEGLDRRSGPLKDAWRDMLTELARLFEPV
jgi:hypothetical protein